MLLDCENLVGTTNLCLITEQINNNNNKSAGMCVMFSSCQREICHPALFYPSITASCISRTLYSSHLFLTIDSSAHNASFAHRATLKLFPMRKRRRRKAKYLIKNQPARNKEKGTGEVKLTLCGFSLILKVMNEVKIQSNTNTRFSWLWRSQEETYEPRGMKGWRRGGEGSSPSELPLLCLCEGVETLRGAYSVSHVERRM